MSDSLELLNMFSDSNAVSEGTYEKVHYAQLSDEQGGVYDSGQISFNTQSMASSNIVYSESYLALPLRITLAADKKIAVKNSILSFIQGLTVDTVAGTSLVSEQLSTPILANLRLLIDSSTDFLDANELMYFGKDQKISGSVRYTPLSAVGGVQPSVTGGIAGIDPFHNPALASRISVFDSRANDAALVSGGPAVSRDLVAIIPLKFIHDFFAQMNFPIQNLALRMTFNISGVSGYTSYCPYTCPSFAAHRTLGDPDATTGVTVVGVDAAALITSVAAQTLAPAVAAVAKPSTIIPQSAAERITKWNTKPSLYLKQVWFAPDDAKALASKIAAGFKHKLTYTVSNHYPSVQGEPDINQPIGQGLIRPTRVWAFPLPTGTLASEANTFPARIGPNGLRDVNIQLNGNNFYSAPFRSQYELYREFKQQLIGAGSSLSFATPISYTDWIYGMNPYVFDLSRNPTVKQNQDCKLTLQARAFSLATGDDLAGSYDLCVVVERLRTCVIDVSAGGVAIMVKDGADSWGKEKMD